MKIIILLLTALFLNVGCSNLETRTYDITLKNDSSKTVIVWLTKDGPAYEKGWKAPEDLAIEKPAADDPYSFQTVPPGKTAYTNKVTGHFGPGVAAILRLYVGQRTFNEILATSRSSPDRIEYTLKPGVNQLTISDDGGGVKINRPTP